jgi:hypothetical protein
MLVKTKQKMTETHATPDGCHWQSLAWLSIAVFGLGYISV